jgi:hypothetical protein
VGNGKQKAAKYLAEPHVGKAAKVSEQVDPHKQVKVPHVESVEKQTPAWQFHRVDRDHEKWGWNRLGAEGLWELLHGKLADFESMTWAEIQRAAGGRSHGNNSHFVEVKDCCKEARDRLLDLRMDDTDEVFSLRLTGTLRLYGIRDGRVLRFIWHDPEHSVYPTKR